MSQCTAEAMRRVRADTRPLDDLRYGLDGYWAVLVVHELTRFPLLAA